MQTGLFGKLICHCLNVNQDFKHLQPHQKLMNLYLGRKIKNAHL